MFDIVRLALAFHVVASVVILYVLVTLFASPERRFSWLAMLMILGTMQVYLTIWMFEIWRWGA
jgi:hypothetical protein